MMDLPRLRPFPKNTVVGISPQQRLAEANVAIERLEENMPSMAETGSLFKQSLLPPRVVSLREVQRYRMLEISKAACDCLQHEHSVAGAILTRAAFETAAVLFYTDRILRTAVKDNALGSAGDSLLRLVVGSRRPNWKHQAVNVLSMINHLNEQYPRMRETYDELCEVAHPNQMGALIAFSHHTRNLDLTLKPTPGFGDQFPPLLVVALTVFEVHYNGIADVFPAFCELCTREAPRSPRTHAR